MKLVNGQWTRITWDQAIDEIGDKLMEIRGKSGPDSVYWLGSAKFTNEGAYLFRKLAAFWGTNNSDHQARICHSTTVDRRGQYLGLRRDDQQLQRHPQLQDADHHGRQSGGSASGVAAASARRQGAQRANFIVIDPRLTRTAAHATEYVRLRPGTDIPVLYGHDVAHLQERLGGQGVHRAARLRHGRRRARKSRSGRRRRSSASPACRARSSSASPRCSRRRSRRP